MCLPEVMFNMIRIDDDKILKGKNAVKNELLEALDGLNYSNIIKKINSNPNTLKDSIADLASLELDDLFSKDQYNFGIYFSLCEWMAFNSYRFKTDTNGKSKFVFTKKYIGEEADRKRVYRSFKKFIGDFPQVLGLFFEDTIIFPSQDKDVYFDKTTFDDFFKKAFEVFLKDTIEIKSLVKYSNHRDKFRKKIIDEWAISYCPYCNISPIIEYDNHEKSTAELDHFLSQVDFPMFALSYGNFIVSCSNCNQKFKNAKYSRLLNIRQQGFDPCVYFSQTRISYKSYYNYENNEVEIKIENKCVDPEKRMQIENSIDSFKLKDCYERNKEAKREVCDVYRSIKNSYDNFYLGMIREIKNVEETKIYEALTDFIIENPTSLELKYRQFDPGYKDKAEIINISFGKLRKDTLTNILRGSKAT